MSKMKIFYLGTKKIFPVSVLFSKQFKMSSSLKIIFLSRFHKLRSQGKGPKIGNMATVGYVERGGDTTS